MRMTSRSSQLINNLQLVVLVIVPFLLILPTIGSINYPPGGNYSDLAITHLPNAEFIKHSILVDHQIPLWNPMIMSGYPFAGDPLSGLWYPPGWLALLFPLPLGINLVLGLHIAAGGIGMFLFLKKLSITQEIAFVSGICFVLLPKIFSHYGAGHITYIYAVSLTPQLMLAELDRKEARSSFNLKTVFLCTFILLADIRWFPFALIAWLCSAFLVSDGRLSIFSKRSLRIIFESFAGLFIAAPFILTFVEFLLRSTRIRMAGGENLIYSLPPERLLGLIIPPAGGFSEWIIYPGLGIMFMVIIGMISKQWKIILPSGIFIFSLLWALGNNITVLGFLESLPGVNMIRVPPRIIFLGEIMAIISAAMTVNWITDQNDKKILKRIILTLSGIVFFVLLLGIGVGVLQHKITSSIIRMVIFCPICFICLILLTRMRRKVIPIIMLGISIGLDLYLTDITMFKFNPDANKTDVVINAELKKDKGLFRVFSPTYAISQQTAEESGIQLAEGVNPMQIGDYVKYFEKASGIPYNSYSVVTPPLIETISENGVQKYDIGKPDTKVLGQLNVRYLILDTELFKTNGWQLISSSKGQWLYQNQNELPRAYLLDNNGNIQRAGVVVEKYTPNEIIISTKDGMGNLVLSEVYYPGWRVWVDGVEKPIGLYEGIFRMIALAGGTHQIVFKFMPASLLVGLFISGITLILLLTITIRKHGNR